MLFACQNPRISVGTRLRLGGLPHHEPQTMKWSGHRTPPAAGALICARHGFPLSNSITGEAPTASFIGVQSRSFQHGKGALDPRGSNEHFGVTGSMNELPVLDASLPEAVTTARECLFGAAAAIVVRTGEPHNLGVRLLDFAAAIGRVVTQTEQGDVLDQVTFTPGPHVRGAKTRRALPFHTDLGPNSPDVFLLGCVSSASHGGATVLVKATDACDVLTRAAPAQVLDR